jgi:hypothetical protein
MGPPMFNETSKFKRINEQSLASQQDREGPREFQQLSIRPNVQLDVLHQKIARDFENNSIADRN